MGDQDRRKVRTRDGLVAMVMNDFGKTCSLKIKGSDYYPVRAQEDLEDMTEEEFVRKWGAYK